MLPKFEKFIYPVLAFYSDEQDHKLTEVKPYIKSYFKLTDEDCAEKTSCGNKTKLSDRADWAVTYLFRAGFVFRTGWGVYHITEKGIEFLKNHKKGITLKSLRESNDFVKFSDKKFLENQE